MDIKLSIRNFVSRTYMALYSLTHPIEKKVLFDSFGGKQYSDNPRAISETLHDLYPDYKIVWIYSGKDEYQIIPEYVKIVPHGTAFYRELATAFCFVTNSGITSAIRKRKGQFFIQTWHGDRPLKKILHDVDPAKKLKIIDYKLTDLCVAGSEAGVSQYRSAFLYKGEILSVGTPRNDALVNITEAKQNKIKKKLGISQEKKILVYAPTYRDNNTKGQQVNVDLHETIRILEQKNEEWVCLIRAHSSASGLNYDYADQHFADVSGYPDMTDLLCIADILITDYSSCAGDLTTRNAMAILAIFDQEEYEKNCRGLVFNLEETGFFIARNQHELNDIIKNRNDIETARNCQTVNTFFGVTESGNSSAEVCKRIDSACKITKAKKGK